MKRLTREEIADVLKRGIRAHGLLCTYLSLPQGTSGVSVIVSKKVAHTAVMRNRIKRRIRAATTHVALPKCALVIIAKSGAINADVSEFRNELISRLGNKV
jgi:ribonuclease P protein component